MDLLFIAFFGLIALAFTVLTGMSFLRGQKTQSWPRVMGQMTEFSVSYGTVSAAYEYILDGNTHQSCAILPGPFVVRKGGVNVPPAVFTHTDGSLRFPVGAPIDVFYNPAHPNDAVLVPGVPPGFWRMLVGTGVAIGLVLLMVLSRSEELIFGEFILVVGVGIFGMGLIWLRRWERSRSFSKTTGTLLRAEVVYAQAQGESGGGFQSVVEFAYRIEGVIYHSQQLCALQFFVQRSSRAAAERDLEKLRAQQPLEVFYDPRAPWDAFLRPNSIFVAALPMTFGILALAAGLWFVLKPH